MEKEYREKTQRSQCHSNFVVSSFIPIAHVLCRVTSGQRLIIQFDSRLNYYSIDLHAAIIRLKTVNHEQGVDIADRYKNQQYLVSR